MKTTQSFKYGEKYYLEFDSGMGTEELIHRVRAVALYEEKLSGWGDVAPSTVNFALIDMTNGVAAQYGLVNNEGHSLDYAFTPENVMRHYGTPGSPIDASTLFDINSVFDEHQNKIDLIVECLSSYIDLEPAQQLGKMKSLLTKLNGGPLDFYQNLKMTRVMERPKAKYAIDYLIALIDQQEVKKERGFDMSSVRPVYRESQQQRVKR